MNKLLAIIKNNKAEIGAAGLGIIGLLFALEQITRDQLEVYGHVLGALTGVAMRADLGVKGYKTHLGFIGLGVVGVLAGTDVLEPNQWMAADALIAAFTGASLQRGIKKANGNGNGGGTAEGK
jgi:hypothetical protein